MSVDIVNLIENNPITKLNGNYQSKLIEKVKTHFTNYEQQLFLSSFYCYLNFNSKDDFVINLDNIWQWLGFSQKVNAKILLEKQFKLNQDYQKLLLVHQKQSGNVKGGHNKETFMLTIKTFKLFCIKAGTSKADEIHEYFIKLEEILQEIIIEESNELKLQLEQKNTEMNQLEDTVKQEYDSKLEIHRILEREKVLLKEYATIGCIFYIIKVKSYDNGQYIIKVGESRRGITDRYKEHKRNHEECLLLDCFTVNRSKDFETFIKDHDLIRPNKVKDLIGHENNMELFLIGKNLSYQTILNIVTNNIKHFNSNDTYKLELEIERLKILVEMKNTNNDNPLIQELIKTNNILLTKMDALEASNKELINKLNPPKLTTGFNQPLATLGPRVQKINPDTMTLIKVYESVSEVMNENKDIKRPSINKAVQENTIYCKYRWLLVERNLDANIIHDISPTKQTKSQLLGYIAKLNNDQTEIINVYIDRKTAALSNGYESSSALDNSVKNHTLAKGFYYKLYDECEEEMRDIFESKLGVESVLLYKNGVGQFDAQNVLVKEFTCKYDCLKSLNMSDKTLAKALDKNIPYKECYYKSIGERLTCI